MTQLTTKTTKRLIELKEKILFLKQGCLERESLGSQLCNDEWNCYECVTKIEAEKREIIGILSEKNELKEIIGKVKTSDESIIALDKVENLIQEIESVENNESKN